MGSAHRRAVTERALSVSSDCSTSPHCKLPPTVAVRFAGLDGIWLHYGPIGANTTPLVVHRAERPPSERNAGALDVETRRGWRGVEGCHLDVFALEHKPGDGASKFVQQIAPGLTVSYWRVFSVAWCDDGDTYVSWTAPGFELPYPGYAQFSGEQRPTAETQAQFDRLLDLLDGGRRRRGRPLLGQNEHWRETAMRCIELKAQRPDLTLKEICAIYKIPERTERYYRRIIERQAVNGADGGLHLVDDGGN